jgi:2,4-dienoyl-CoA reductase (NADPH2)
VTELRQVDPLFEPLAFRNLTVKNRVFRSSISGRIDNYDGSGTPARVNWEERFAAGGVGAIISAHVPVHVRGRILPNYAFIDNDDKIPFWRAVGQRVHAYDCRFILQLSHGGRQRDVAGVENDGNRGLSSTSTPDSFEGFAAEAMTEEQIKEVTGYFAAGARRAREAGLDGVELHACNGYLFTQFLSSAINDRADAYGGPIENRARFLLEVIAAVRREVGRDFHLQVKISAIDHGRAFEFWDKPGNTLSDSLRVCEMVEAAGADSIHVSVGNTFPHPLNPAGGFPIGVEFPNYGVMIASGRWTFRNFVMFRYRPSRWVARRLWLRTVPASPEGVNVRAAAAVKRRVSIPVIVTGGFQTASVVRRLIADGAIDGVSIARSLLANPDLVHQWESGRDRPDKPCTYCNKCLFNVLENPLGCYEVSRFDGDHDAMIKELMSFYSPDGFETPNS